MNYGYIKLSRELLESSLWMGGSPDEIVVWMYLLLKADPDTGIVEDIVPAIARGCHISRERVEEILDTFSKPDKYSRSKEFEGRRIQLPAEGEEWAIRLLNFRKYQTKDYTAAARQRKHRAKAKGMGVAMDDDVTRDNRDKMPDVTQLRTKNKELRTNNQEPSRLEDPSNLEEDSRLQVTEGDLKSLAQDVSALVSLIGDRGLLNESAAENLLRQVNPKHYPDLIKAIEYAFDKYDIHSFRDFVDQADRFCAEYLEEAQ